jgi:hypothetical protein
MDSGHYLLDRAVLENIAFASQFHRAAEEILIGMKGQKDDFYFQPGLNQFPCDAEPIELRHLDIEQCHVWMKLLNER